MQLQVETTHFWQALQSFYSYSIVAEPKNSALFHKTIAQIVPLVTCIFWYSAIADLIFDELYGHFKAENVPFLFLFPWGIIWQVTITMISLRGATWFLFEVSICLDSKVVIPFRAGKAQACKVYSQKRLKNSVLAAYQWQYNTDSGTISQMPEKLKCNKQHKSLLGKLHFLKLQSNSGSVACCYSLQYHLL